MENRTAVLVNWAQAWERTDAVSDLGQRQFVRMALTLVLTLTGAGKHPVEKFDALFFAELMTDLYNCKDDITRILGGEDLRWFPDGDK